MHPCICEENHQLTAGEGKRSTKERRKSRALRGGGEEAANATQDDGFGRARKNGEKRERMEVMLQAKTAIAVQSKCQEQVLSKHCTVGRTNVS